MGESCSFRVFIAGGSWRSQRVVEAFQELCTFHGISGDAVEVIDVLQDPAGAERDRVLALPMVMRVWPPPVVRVVGDLSDRGVVASVLGLTRDRHDEPREPAAGGGS